MLQYLNRARSRKGFTLIELIVVIAIIGVLTAIVLPMISVRDNKIKEANSTARDFYTAMQMVMTNYSLYEGPLTPEYREDPNRGEMRYFEKMNGNFPYVKGATAGDFPETASLYVEITVKNNEITNVCTYTEAGSSSGYDQGAGFFHLCQRTAEHTNSVLGNLLKADLENRLHYLDGAYYAKVEYESIPIPGSGFPSKMETETLKVKYTGYCRNPLPNSWGEAFNTYKNNNMYFGEDNVLVNGDVFGVCAPLSDSGSIVGIAGTNLN